MRNFDKNLVGDSETVAINTLAQAKAKAGIKVFNFSAGEPKLLPHQDIVRAAVKALKQGKTLYPPVSGISELKQEAASWMNKNYNSQFNDQNTLVVNGGKFGLFLTLQMILEKGDEVLIPLPAWVSYTSMVKLFKGTPKFLQASEESGWKITASQVSKACTRKTKILILNSGCNPTGAVYSQKELGDILKIARQKNLLVISDEVYSGLVYDNNKFASCASFKQFRNRVVIIHSCSKNFAMTGWRVGFVFGPESLVKNLTSLVSQSTSGVTTVSQWAALGALKNSKKIISEVKGKMQQRRNIFLREFKKNFGINLQKPKSGLYAFVSLKDLGVKENLSVNFCTEALQKANVAMVPGKAFGQEGYVRFSFGGEPKSIIEGLKRLKSFCAKL